MKAFFIFLSCFVEILSCQMRYSQPSVLIPAHCLVGYVRNGESYPDLCLYITYRLNYDWFQNIEFSHYIEIEIRLTLNTEFSYCSIIYKVQPLCHQRVALMRARQTSLLHSPKFKPIKCYFLNKLLFYSKIYVTDIVVSFESTIYFLYFCDFVCNSKNWHSKDDVCRSWYAVRGKTWCNISHVFEEVEIMLISYMELSRIIYSGTSLDFCSYITCIEMKFRLILNVELSYAI